MCYDIQDEYKSGLKNSCYLFSELRCAEFKCFEYNYYKRTFPSDHTASTSNCSHSICNCNWFEDIYHASSFSRSSHLSAALINCSWSCCYQRWWFSPWFPSGVLPHSRTGNNAPGSQCGRSGRQVSCTLALLCLVLGGQRSQTRTKSHHSSPH